MFQYFIIYAFCSRYLLNLGMRKIRKKFNLYVRWLARIWSILSIAFLTFMVFAHIIGGEFGSFNSTQEFIMFCFFPIGIIIGMLIAWKNEGLGGAITTVSIIMFHIIGNLYSLDIWIDGLSVPGILFLLSWKISKSSTIIDSFFLWR